MVKQIVFISLLFLVWQNAVCQIGIGTLTPDKSSVFDVSSTDKGILIPRLTTSQRDNIATPAKGLTIYNKTEHCLQVNIGTKSNPDWNCQRASSYETTVINNCNLNGFEGTYSDGLVLTNANKFSVTLTNNSFGTASIAFSTSDLVLSGVSGVSVVSVNPPSAVLISGQSISIEYTLTGTLGGSGILSGVWTKLGLNCTKVIDVTVKPPEFSLPQQVYVISTYDGTPLIDFPGVVDNTINQLTVKIPYTSGTGSYSGYTSSYVINNNGTGESGDINSFKLSYPPGTYDASGSGNIIATIEVDGDEIFNVKKQQFGVQELIVSLDFQVDGVSFGNIDLIALGGIPDRNYADADHKFIYLPVTAKDGRIWLNNNLGANYSNTNKDVYNPIKQAEIYQDYNAYGSLFQWGRYSDGHELIDYTSANSGTGVTGKTATQETSSIPTHDLFIYTYNDWLSVPNNNLWQGETGISNPCPLGFRVPTIGELNTLVSSEGINNNATAHSSTLALSTPGYREKFTGEVQDAEATGYLWSSTLYSGTGGPGSRWYHLFDSQSGWYFRSTGSIVRCIKN